MEAFHHPVVEQRVGERDEGHAGVMGEVRAHHRAMRVGLHLAIGVSVLVRLSFGVIDGVEIAVVAFEPCGGQRAQVGCASGRIDDRCQRCRVRSDDEFVTQPALQPKPRNAKRLVLVRVVPIDDVVGGLGDAPRHVARGGVLDLPAHDHAARFVEERVRVAAHDEQRHQVLEHRRAPRQQHGGAADAGDRASEMEPVRFRDVALGNGKKAGQPRFRGEQVVVRRIDFARAFVTGEAIADGE